MRPADRPPMVMSKKTMGRVSAIVRCGEGGRGEEVLARR
jgi:hypothetical protein